MNRSKSPRHLLESLEPRRLLAWSSYASLVGQDTAASQFPSITGKGVTVAVIDTGIDYNLPQLGGGFGKGHKVIAGYDFYANDSDPMDGSGHGTNVASVIAAKPFTTGGVTYQGVAPDANLVALRVGTESNISDDNIERALQWVASNYKTYGISVVNLSLGSGFYPDAETSFQLSDEFKQLHDLGIFVVAASGNSNDAISGPISADGIAYPAADPNVFAVGAVDSSDIIASWSQRGDELDLLAPGVNITMLKRGGGFVTEDGTSFASPYVAGAAALIKQETPSALAGDIGSILMGSGTLNRDGSGETGNTTTLDYSRLDISAALTLANQRVGKDSTIAVGRYFDTALDSQGVLHAAWYTDNGDLYYATRDTSGLWSSGIAVDTRGDVGAQPTIAVDHSGKTGIGYFDVTNTAVKYAWSDSTTWRTQTIESNKHVGTSPSLAFDIDGNGYLAYYKRSGGDLRMATLDRDTGVWTRRTVDGAGAVDVGKSLSLDVGEAAVRANFGFTVYDTTVAVAYADTTNGNLKYARLDLDDPTATWFVAVVDDTSGVANIDLNLHADAGSALLRAQIAYQDTATADVKYAYRNTDWFVETVASTGKLGDSVQLFFDADGAPLVTFYDRLKRALFTSTRTGIESWSKSRTASSAGPQSIGFSERTGEATLSYLNRPRSEVFSTQLI